MQKFKLITIVLFSFLSTQLIGQRTFNIGNNCWDNCQSQYSATVEDATGLVDELYNYDNDNDGFYDFPTPIPARFNGDFVITNDNDIAAYDIVFRIENLYDDQPIDFEAFDYVSAFGATIYNCGFQNPINPWYRIEGCAFDDPVNNGTIDPITLPIQPIVANPNGGTTEIASWCGPMSIPFQVQQCQNYQAQFSSQFLRCPSGYTLTFRNIEYGTIGSCNVNKCAEDFTVVWTNADEVPGSSDCNIQEGRLAGTGVYDITASPNPVGNTLTISLADATINSPVAIELYDLAGKLIYSEQQIDLNSYQLDFTEMNAGIYVLAVYNDEGILHTQKITK